MDIQVCAILARSFVASTPSRLERSTSGSAAIAIRPSLALFELAQLRLKQLTRSAARRDAFGVLWLGTALASRRSRFLWNTGNLESHRTTKVAPRQFQSGDKSPHSTSSRLAALRRVPHLHFGLVCGPSLTLRVTSRTNFAIYVKGTLDVQTQVFDFSVEAGEAQAQAFGGLAFIGPLPQDSADVQFFVMPEGRAEVVGVGQEFADTQ